MTRRHVHRKSAANWPAEADVPGKVVKETGTRHVFVPPNGLPISRRERTTTTVKIAMISRAKRSAAWAGWAGAPLERQTEASATDGAVTRATARGGITPTGSTRSTTGLRRLSG